MTLQKVVCRLMQGLSDQALNHLAQCFSALAEPTRLRILHTLRDKDFNVGELARYCGSSQANISRHLSTLAKHGLVQRESRGTAVYYRIADPSIYALCDLVCNNIVHQLRSQADVLGI